MEKIAFFPAAKIYYYILNRNLKTAFFSNKKGTEFIGASDLIFKYTFKGLPSKKRNR